MDGGKYVRRLLGRLLTQLKNAGDSFRDGLTGIEYQYKDIIPIQSRSAGFPTAAG